MTNFVSIFAAAFLALPLLYTDAASIPEDFKDLADAAEPCGTYDMDPGESISIASENFATGKDYPKDQNCIWKFKSSNYSTVMVIDCPYFKIQKSSDCSKDFLLITDKNALKERYCGQDPPNNNVTGVNFLKVRFHSDGSKQREGFVCNVTAVYLSFLTTTEPPPTTTTIPPTESTTTDRPTTTTTEQPTPPTGYKCECGVPGDIGRMMNGNRVPVEGAPWLISITPPRLLIPFCSGILLSNRHVLTAGTCVDGLTDQSFDLIANEHNWSQLNHIVKRKAKAILVHPNYNKKTGENNMAILELEHPLNLAGMTGIKPICIPSENDRFTGLQGIVTGWGSPKHGGPPSRFIRRSESTILTHAQCQKELKGFFGSQLCSGDASTGPTLSDLGSPLSVEIGGVHVLAGVVSKIKQGKPCTFEKITSFLSWINGIISSGKFCIGEAPTPPPTPEPITSPTTPEPSATPSPSIPDQTTEGTTTKMPMTNEGLPCACGNRSAPITNGRSNGGSPFPIRYYPWTVAAMDKSSKTPIGAATIINTLYSLTAKSVVSSRSYGSTQLWFNAHNLNGPNYEAHSRIIMRDIESIIYKDELALIKVTQAVTLTKWDGVKPLCFPLWEKNFVDFFYIVTGYGSLTGASSPSLNANAGFGEVQPASACGASSDSVCLSPTTSKGFCKHDKGGPVASYDKGRWRLVGIAVEEVNCGAPQRAAKFASYYSWVIQNSQAGRFCEQ